MQRDWQNFKALHHNIEGAREGFEKACETLFRKVYPSEYVSQMAVKQGDGGIDIFVGKFSIKPIIVIQCKFFLDSFGEAQKAQIRNSFNRAKNSQKYVLKEWILVLPRVIDIEENSWWFNWIGKQDIAIHLINGNKLIDLMKEHNVYNQIFQMEDSLKIDRIDKQLKELVTNQDNKIIETPLPQDQSRHITIELEPVDNDNFKIIILEESEEKEYLEVKFSDDKAYSRNEIVDIVDEFIDKNYENVLSSNIFLVFVLPSNLMSENIDFWKLSDDDRTLGDEYTVLLRGRERFRKEGVFSRKRLYNDWKSVWDNCKQKYNEEICDISHQVACGQEKLQTRRVEETPFIILDYHPNEKNLKTLYRSHISIMMWANNCKDKNKFSELLKKHENEKLGEIHTKLYKFKPNETGLDANIMLLYDDPNKLPFDNNAPQLEVPQ